MGWKKRKKPFVKDFPDVAYLPPERTGWDFTLAALAYGARREIECGKPDLGRWAARHGLPPSARASDLGEDAAILWHGTSRARADKIAEHGLFSKGGLWTTSDPRIAHAFTRGRSERFAAEGAMVCLVMDRRVYAAERDFVVEGGGDVFRFHKGLPADVVEYVLVHGEGRFLGPGPASAPAPWPSGKFKKRGGEWVPLQKPPARYSDAASYSTAAEFAGLCLRRLLDELGEVAAVEVFSALYSLIEPWEALTHEDVFDLIEEHCERGRRRGKIQALRPRGARPLSQ
jgi:hypothetical protein